MCKKIPLTVLSGMLATLNPAEAKISRCEDEKGHVTFSDSGCNNPDKGTLKQTTDPRSVFPASESPSTMRKTFFYCHSGKKKYKKC